MKYLSGIIIITLIAFSACIKSNPEVERTFRGRIVDSTQAPIANTSLVLTHVIFTNKLNDKKFDYKNYSFATDGNGYFSVKATSKSNETFKILYPDEAKGDYSAPRLWAYVTEDATDIDAGTIVARRK